MLSKEPTCQARAHIALNVVLSEPHHHLAGPKQLSEFAKRKKKASFPRAEPQPASRRTSGTTFLAI